MRTLDYIAAELGVTLNDVISYDQSLMDNSMIRDAVHYGDWDRVGRSEISDEDANDLIDSFRGTDTP